MAFSAKVLCDSVTEHDERLTTIEVTFPRIVLAEFNTHRMFSRNSASSRAIPVEKRITAVETDPFIPAAFGKNKKGMQSSENLNDVEAKAAAHAWKASLIDAVKHARALAQLGVHKQLANRLIEPYCWQTVIVTATEWGNFYALRCHPDAQPEIKRAAELMREVYEASTPKLLKEGRWHLPLTPELDDVRARNGVIDFDYWKRVSVGRCARVSYLTHDGRRDLDADIDLCNKLQASGHMSPFEHVARPKTDDESWDMKYLSNFNGWVQFRKELLNEDDYSKVLRT